MASRSSKFGIGLLLGTVIGGVAAFFLSPKSGKENQKMAKKKFLEFKKVIEEGDLETEARKIFGDVTEKTKGYTTQLQKAAKARMAEMQDAVTNVDIEKFKKQVVKITDDLQKEGATQDLLDKAKKYLMSFVDKIADDVKEEIKEVIPGDKKSATKSSTTKKSN